MNNSEKLQIKTLVQQRMSDKQLSANTASAMMGLSSASLSNMLNDKWDDISDRLWMKAARWAGLQGEWKIRETPNLKSIFSLCEDAQENARMVGCAGPTGYGKTTALKYYASKTPNSFYFLATKVMRPKDFLHHIIMSLGMDEGGSINRRMYMIIEKLRECNSPLLILDDCGKLPDPCLLLIQVLYDELEGHCGFVLGGTDAFKKHLFKQAARDVNGFRELKRRIGYWQPLKGIHPGFIAQVAKDFGIVEDDRNLQDPAVKYIQQNCTDYGSLKELLTNYQRFVKKHNTEGMTKREILAQIHYGSAQILEAA